MTDMMNAFVLMGHGDFDMLAWHESWPVPVPSGDEVLIKVGACGLNNTDINTRTAWYSKSVSENTTGGAFDDADDEDATWGGAAITFPRIQGADVVGEVVGLGAEADQSLLGKRVMIDTWLRDWSDPDNRDKCGYYGSECDGGFAQYTKISQKYVHPVSSSLSDAELATFATSYITAENMLERAQVTKGDSVLITGASGGVGSALIQLAKRRGAITIGLSSPSKAESLYDIGADHVIDRNTSALKDDIEAATGKRTVSVLADVVGGDNWHHWLDCIERGGRLTCAGAIAGPMVTFDLRTFYLRDLTFTGATIVPVGLFARLVSYIEAGELKPLLAAQYPLRDLHDAQRAFIAKSHIGNIVVTP
ncbi:MAG: alcohol dehydrogenase family protein [Candidatus Puniceispirillaceae bacterium]